MKMKRKATSRRRHPFPPTSYPGLYFLFYVPPVLLPRSGNYAWNRTQFPLTRRYLDLEICVATFDSDTLQGVKEGFQGTRTSRKLKHATPIIPRPIPNVSTANVTDRTWRTSRDKALSAIRSRNIARQMPPRVFQNPNKRVASRSLRDHQLFIKLTRPLFLFPITYRR